MVSSAVAGLLLGRLVSWFIATVMRPTLSWVPASAALAVYFGLVGITGAIVGNLSWDGASKSFTCAFLAGFVISPAVVREAGRLFAGSRGTVSLGSLVLGPLALLLVILFGFFLAQLSYVHA